MVCGFLILVMAGCGGGAQRRSVIHEQAVSNNQKGTNAYEKGRFREAIAYYEEALRRCRSIEHSEGIASNLINLAAVHRRLGERQAAHGYLDEFKALSSFLSLPDAKQAEASFLRARLHADEENYPQAETFLAEARSCDERSGEKIKGRILNLSARIALKNGESAEAEHLAEAGWQWNRSVGDLPEEANSLRSMAEAELALKNFRKARRYFKKALRYDKEVGLSRKIALDLLGIASAYINEGRQEAARPYLSRAISVSRSSGDEGTAKQAEKLLQDY